MMPSAQGWEEMHTTDLTKWYEPPPGHPTAAIRTDAEDEAHPRNSAVLLTFGEAGEHTRNDFFFPCASLQ